MLEKWIYFTVSSHHVHLLLSNPVIKRTGCKVCIALPVEAVVVQNRACSGDESLKTCADLADFEIKMKRIDKMKYNVTKMEKTSFIARKIGAYS